MYKNVQCTCGRTFTIEVSKGEPLQPLCNVCSAKLTTAIEEACEALGKTSVSFFDLKRLRRRQNGEGEQGERGEGS